MIGQPTQGRTLDQMFKEQYFLWQRGPSVVVEIDFFNSQNLSLSPKPQSRAYFHLSHHLSLFEPIISALYFTYSQSWCPPSVTILWQKKKKKKHVAGELVLHVGRQALTLTWLNPHWRKTTAACLAMGKLLFSACGTLAQRMLLLWVTGVLKK